MFKIKYQNKFGFINAEGEVVISPQYEVVRDFSEGLAWVVIEKNDEWKAGFINEKGEFAIPPQFSGYGLSDTETIYFSGGIAPIYLGKNKMTFINSHGNAITDETFEQAFSFSEGRALVKKNNLYGYVDRNIKLIVDYKFQKPYFFGASAQFSEGIALVHLIDSQNFENEETPCYGYIKDNGELLFNARLTAGTVFKEGFAMIRTPETLNHYFVINKEGKLAFDKSSIMASTFSDGLLSFYDNDTELFGYLNKDGDWHIQPQFILAQKFSEGLAVFQDSDSELFGYLNKEGDIAIPPQFSSCLPFSKGLAFVQKDGVSGYITTSGQYIWKAR